MKRTYLSPEGFVVVLAQVCCVQAHKNPLHDENSSCSVFFAGGGGTVIHRGPSAECIAVRDALTRELEEDGD